MEALLGRGREREVHASAWRRPERGLWVASSDGSFHGMVERVGTVYRGVDAGGAVAGDFSTLDEALRALNASVSLDLIHRYEERGMVA